MSVKTDRNRVTDREAFERNYERIMNKKHVLALYIDMPRASDKTAVTEINDSKTVVRRHFGIIKNEKLVVIAVIYRSREFMTLRGTPIIPDEIRFKLDQRSINDYRDHFEVQDQRGVYFPRCVGVGKRKDDGYKFNWEKNNV